MKSLANSIVSQYAPRTSPTRLVGLWRDKLDHLLGLWVGTVIDIDFVVAGSFEYLHEFCSQRVCIVFHFYCGLDATRSNDGLDTDSTKLVQEPF